MRISRRGTQRDRGAKVLVNVRTEPKDPGGSTRFVHPSWDPETKRVTFDVEGIQEGAVRHLYTVEMTPREVADLIEAFTRGDKHQPRDPAVRAQGAAMAAYVRSLGES